MKPLVVNRPLAALAALLCGVTAAFAIAGDAPDAAGVPGRAVVMITGSGSSLCSGVAIARDIVLTAAHCVARPQSAVRASKTSAALAIRDSAVHPRFDLQSYARHRATADVALIKLAAPLPPEVVPAPLALPDLRLAPGDRVTVAGFGTRDGGSGAGLGVARSAELVVTGQPGSLQVRLYDPATRNQRAGLGACDGDSGAPAFRGERIAGVVTWSTGPGNSAGCGGLTGVTPLTLYRAWIVEQVRRMGGTLAP